jgi:cation transport ATPase
MIKTPPLRVALGTDGVSIWSPEIFGTAEPSRLRDFLSRAFAVQEVEGVELRPARAFGRIRYGGVNNPAQIWRKLSRALSSPGGASGFEDATGFEGPAGATLRRVDAGLVYLDGLGARSVRVSRIGDVLSTWRVRQLGESELRLWHPLLRNRRDVVFRLEEELAAIPGVQDFKASALTAGVSIRFDASTTTAERLARELERAWPRLLGGLDGAPSQTRLMASVGLVGLAFTGQYLAPAVRPIAVAGVTLYSFPNVINATRQVTRGEIGLSALYTTGLALMLVSGLPFTASVMAALMQFWPHLARRKIQRSQRRLFAGPRRRPSWSRLVQAEGVEVEVHVDDLRAGDVIVVRRGETIPVDGVVADGSAAVVEDAAFGGRQVEDKSPGDAVAASTFVRDGNLTIRVERSGALTSASYVDSLLPRSSIAGLPSSLEAERRANRNAKPALALAGISLLLTRTLRPSQAVLRPDYATAPRLSVQLSALRGVADGVQRGVLFKNPAALDRLAVADVYVIDESAGLGRRSVEVATVQTVEGLAVELAVGYALAAYGSSRSEQSRALAAFASKRKPVHPTADAIRRYAGVSRYRDRLGGAIEIATSRYLATSNISIPPGLQTGSVAPGRDAGADQPDREPSLRPLWVLRDGQVIAGISFARTGEFVGRQVVAALQAQNNRPRVVYVSQKGKDESLALARALGIQFPHGDLTPADKLELIRGLGRQTLWIGDGSDPGATQAIAASSVSISLAPLSRSREDAADILLPHQGLSVLPEVVALGRAHAERLAKDYRTVYRTNLLGVAGAFLANFNALHSGLLSNFGTALVYTRHARALERLAAAADEQRARLQSPALG